MTEQTKGQYREFTVEFEGWDDEPVTVKVSLRKPTVPEVKRYTDLLGRSKDAVAAGAGLLRDIVQPEQKEQLNKALADHPGLPLTLTNDVLKRIGLGGN